MIQIKLKQNKKKGKKKRRRYKTVPRLNLKLRQGGVILNLVTHGHGGMMSTWIGGIWAEAEAEAWKVGNWIERGDGNLGSCDRAEWNWKWKFMFREWEGQSKRGE